MLRYLQEMENRSTWWISANCQRLLIESGMVYVVFNMGYKSQLCNGCMFHAYYIYIYIYKHYTTGTVYYASV